MMVKIKSSEAARRRAGCGFFRWHVLYTLQDARSEALWQVRERLNLPWLAIVPLDRIAHMVGMAEYACKFQVYEAPFFVLRCAEQEAAAWWN